MPYEQNILPANVGAKTRSAEYAVTKNKAREKNMYEDRTLVCRDCGAEFVFTVGEQEFFAEKGFTNDPVRCRECRASKKATRRERVTYRTVCANCGAETEVPFIPKNDKPIYCNECFAQMRNR